MTIWRVREVSTRQSACLFLFSFHVLLHFYYCCFYLLSLITVCDTLLKLNFSHDNEAAFLDWMICMSLLCGMKLRRLQVRFRDMDGTFGHCCCCFLLRRICRSQAVITQRVDRSDRQFCYQSSYFKLFHYALKNT